MNVTHQPGLLRSFCINAFTAQHHSAGQRFANTTDKPLRTARTRHGAESNLRQTKTRVIPGNHQVAQQRQLAARAQRVTVNHRDQRLVEGINTCPQAWANIVESGGQIFFRHFIKIGPGGEIARVAANHANADAGVRRRAFQRVSNLR